VKLRMGKTLRFWGPLFVRGQKYKNPNRTRAELIAEILREYQCEPMRYLNANGYGGQQKIAAVDDAVITTCSKNCAE
jgi:hypothetical protein